MPRAAPVALRGTKSSAIRPATMQNTTLNAMLKRAMYRMFIQ